MATEPPVKRAIASIDGQNLYFAAREAFGYTYPNYDVLALSRTICERNSWQLLQARFYTGIPDPPDDASWNYFWSHKLAMLGRQGVFVYSRPLRYRNRRVQLPDATEHTYLSAQPPGIVGASTRPTGSASIARLSMPVWTGATTDPNVHRGLEIIACLSRSKAEHARASPGNRSPMCSRPSAIRGHGPFPDAACDRSPNSRFHGLTD